MAEEKKGLFGRLLEFWKEKTEEKSGGIGFRNREKTERKTAAEKMPDVLRQEKTEKQIFREGTMQRAAEKAEKQTFREGTMQRMAEKTEQELLQKERKQLFSAEKAEEKKEPALRKAEEKTQKKETMIPIFAAEIFREKTEGRTEEDKRKTIFMQEEPFAEKEQRKIVPIAAKAKPAEKAAAEEEEEAEEPQAAQKKEREQTKGSEIDIERLMREMTKKLWEERETSGRRLRR